jgi:hypothetical protein
MGSLPSKTMDAITDCLIVTTLLYFESKEAGEKKIESQKEIVAEIAGKKNPVEVANPTEYTAEVYYQTFGMYLEPTYIAGEE